MTVTQIAEISRAELLDTPLGSLLARSGAALVRAAGIADAAALADLASELGLSMTEQPEPFAIRRDLGRGVWSEPAWPSTSPMCMHHELGWQKEPPDYLLVACLQPAISGGRTGVADGVEVLSLLPDTVVQHTAEHGWTLTRRYADGLIGMPWQHAFPGWDRAAVEDYAVHEQLELTWTSDSLSTKRSRAGVIEAGPNHLPAWCNLLTFCSEWTMDPAVREFLVTNLGREHLPFETRFGDGSEFTADHVAAVNAAYDAATAHVRWSAGDLLLVDNRRTAHSMEPYSGERSMAVAHARRKAESRVILGVNP